MFSYRLTHVCSYMSCLVIFMERACTKDIDASSSKREWTHEEKCDPHRALSAYIHAYIHMQGRLRRRGRIRG